MPSQFNAKWHGLGHAFPFLLLCDVLAVLALSTGNVAISWWIVTKGVGVVYAGFGVCLLLTTLTFPLVPGVKHFLGLDHTQVKDWYGKQHPAVFGLVTGAVTVLPE
jgi:hypothetical protein